MLFCGAIAVTAGSPLMLRGELVQKCAMRSYASRSNDSATCVFGSLIVHSHNLPPQRQRMIFVGVWELEGNA